jgi:hypothetical protein
LQNGAAPRFVRRSYFGALTVITTVSVSVSPAPSVTRTWEVKVAGLLLAAGDAEEGEALLERSLACFDSLRAVRDAD